jgi:two-component system, chemotaxis family, CheB/CheR fusion protein
VGLGASAGGLEAFEQFFTHMPGDSGLAFVLVSHLDPEHESLMTELLRRFTPMPVEEAGDGMRVIPNRVYVIPPNRYLFMDRGALRLSPPPVPRGLRLPIDAFFRSLAEDQGNHAACVILSGNGSDGTLGLRAVHGAGGLSLVQAPADARFDGMPRSAVSTGLADLVLPVAEMPAQLLAYARQIPFGKRSRRARVVAEVPAPLQKILFLVRQDTGHDFSLYKSSTILRRLERRMALHQIGEPEVYARYLEESPGEIKLLFKDLLIGVTSFFRDPEAFEALKAKVIPQLLDQQPPDQPVRVWVPGCATGEEAYSLAMLFREYGEEHGYHRRVNLFATDIDEEAIATARAGVYLQNIAADVSPERLERFFIKEGAVYRIKQEVRESVVFAVQNVIKDPPFTRLDLLSCRNLLIYLGTDLQDQLVPLFHYSLKPGGCLFLGTSETIGGFTDLFSIQDPKWKFYQRRESAVGIHPVRFSAITGIREPFPPPLVPVVRGAGIEVLARKILLEHLTPPAVLVNERGDVLYIHGRTGKYLEPSPGAGVMNILEMAREGYAFELAGALRQAVATQQDTACRRLKVKTDNGFAEFGFTIKPLRQPEGLLATLLVVFDEPPPPPAKAPKGRRRQPPAPSPEIAALAEELQFVKADLQAAIEELQANNEELQSANEELHSTNEELQSTNEELDTSREEIQSVNEELLTVNAELQTKMENLFRAESDMKNLLDSTRVAMIFLDRHLRLRRFTPAAVRLVKLIPTDVGRCLGDLALNLDYDQLLADAREVFNTLKPREREVRGREEPDRDPDWFQVRLIPYLTVDHVVEGVVIIGIDITRLKQAEELAAANAAAAMAARQYAENIVDTVREPLLVLDGDLRVVSANRSLYEFFHVPLGETIGRSIFALGQGQWDIPDLRRLLEEILPEKTVMLDFRVEHDFPGIGPRTMLLNARRIEPQGPGPAYILLALEDISGKG